MITKTFGIITTTIPRDYAKELQDVVGVSLPVGIVLNNVGELIGVSYESEWKDGGTKPITDKKGNVTDYEEDYTVKKLTKDQIIRLDNYIKENVKVD